ncbi:MAG TPA: molybdenum cofactor guanylyltransferase [Puia sp.]|jgi:molybdopterin-guanine dinucleotide biosynthesis protein A|nr:molybdenum cofactor guanylyltransferase [Puia sp.]
MNRLTGVVLCGGQSRRMGRDKGLIGWDGVCWAARMGRLLAAFGMPVVYSIRAEQEAAYSVVLPEARMVADAVEIDGPLNGLFSVHRRFVDRDLLVLACDMQDMDEVTIGELIGEYRKGGAEFYVYYEGEFVQPFCAVYTAAGLERVSSMLGEERRLRGVIEKGVVRRLEVRKKEAFGNYNFSSHP